MKLLEEGSGVETIGQINCVWHGLICVHNKFGGCRAKTVVMYTGSGSVEVSYLRFES